MLSGNYVDVDVQLRCFMREPPLKTLKTGTISRLPLYPKTIQNKGILGPKNIWVTQPLKNEGVGALMGSTIPQKLTWRHCVFFKWLGLFR